MAGYWQDQDMVSHYRDLAEKTRNTTGTTRDKEQAAFNTNVAGNYDDQQQKWNQQLANTYEDLANRYEYNKGKDWLNSKDLLTPYMQAEQLQKQIGQGLEGRGTKVDSATTQADQALQAQQQSNQAAAQANKTANINAGINKSRAGMLGSQAASTDNSVAQNQYMANRSTAASTQADYLEKMAQADALDQNARNMSRSAGLASLSGALTGAGSGAALGAVVSDENAKEEPIEDPIDDNKLQEAIAEFKRLSDRLKQLKGEK
jgi:hypothetical protein